MSTTPGDGADGDGLVFISYSHADVGWAQRFRVLLKPLVRRKHLRLWDDTQIRIGDGVASRDRGGDRPQSRLWDPARGIATATSVSPDGRRLASAGVDRDIRLWSLGRSRSVATLAGHDDAVDAVAWTPDGTLLASTGVDQTLRTWDPLPGALLTTSGTHHFSRVHSLAWSPDGAHLATADSTGLVMVWDRQLRAVASLQLKPSACLAWDASLIAVGRPGRPAILELRDPTDLLT